MTTAGSPIEYAKVLLTLKNRDDHRTFHALNKLTISASVYNKDTSKLLTTIARTLYVANVK